MCQSTFNIIIIAKQIDNIIIIIYLFMDDYWMLFFLVRFHFILLIINYVVDIEEFMVYTHNNVRMYVSHINKLMKKHNDFYV